MMHLTRRRAGFTLVEMMVVMAILAFLTATVMLVAPDIMAKDRARDAASQLQGALQNARMRAMRDNLPRGVRLLIDPPPGAGSSFIPYFTTASAFQYIEVPPWLVFTNPTGGQTPPYLQFSYTTNPQTATISGTTYPAYSVGTTANTQNRVCTINNLTPTQYLQIQAIANNAQTSLPPVLFVPNLGNFFSSIIQFIPSPPNSYTLQLSIYPDSVMGAATNYVAYTGTNGPAYFGIYQPARPLLGEPVMNLPVNTTVDLSDGVSQPSFTAVGGYSSSGSPPGYDVLFSPSGQMMSPYGVGQVYLWVRDPTKGVITPGLPQNPNKNGGPFCSMSPSAPSLGGVSWAQFPTVWAQGNQPPYLTALQNGGEQLLVTIKANSGGTGVSPVFWPNTSSPTPYLNAILAANSQ